FCGGVVRLTSMGSPVAYITLWLYTTPAGPCQETSGRGRWAASKETAGGGDGRGRGRVEQRESPRRRVAASPRRPVAPSPAPALAPAPAPRPPLTAPAPPPP